jgi:hypothetical protein
MGLPVDEVRNRATARTGRAVKDRVMVAASSRLPTDLVPLLARHRLVSGLAVVGAAAARTCRTVHAVDAELVVAADTEAYLASQATPMRPDDPADRDAAELHNVTSWLTVAERMISAVDRMEWLRGYRHDLAVAYEALRLETGVRAIRPYGSARHWLSLTD